MVQKISEGGKVEEMDTPSSNSQKSEEKKTANKKMIILIFVFLLIVAALIGVIAFLLLKREEAPEEKGGVYTMEEDNYIQIMDEMSARVSEGNFETYMNTNWIFADGTSETQNAVLGNSPNNTKPIRCEVVLNDTGETVFTTGVIPVGSAIPPFKLDVDLDAGVYEAVCNVYLLQEAEDGSYVEYSSAGFGVTITVQD